MPNTVPVYLGKRILPMASSVGNMPEQPSPMMPNAIMDTARLAVSMQTMSPMPAMIDIDPTKTLRLPLNFAATQRPIAMHSQKPDSVRLANSALGVICAI